MKHGKSCAQRLLLALIGILALWACDSAVNGARKPVLKIPRGYVPRLEIQIEGRLYGFGPFVGYYFRPRHPQNVDLLDFVVFNERGFYTRDLPVNARLFEGDAVLKILPPAGHQLPSAAQRIEPVFFEEAPGAWKRTRPQPEEEYLHFHSCYDARGAVRRGYWLRHRGFADFTYDMGGRVGADSPLHHRVSRGVDRNFARIIEFDSGPQ